MKKKTNTGFIKDIFKKSVCGYVYSYAYVSVFTLVIRKKQRE